MDDNSNSRELALHSDLLSSHTESTDGSLPNPISTSLPHMSTGSMATEQQILKLIKVLSTDGDWALPEVISPGLAHKVAVAIAKQSHLPGGPKPKRLGRSPKGAHLIVRSRKASDPVRKSRRGDDPMVYIRDGETRKSTHCRESQMSQAVAALELHKMFKENKQLAKALPTQVKVAVVVYDWLTVRRPLSNASQSALATFKRDESMAGNILSFFGKRRLNEITASRCDAYVEQRIRQPGQGQDREGRDNMVSDQTACSELQFLNKALKSYDKANNLGWVPKIKMPKRNGPRLSWVNRGEAARGLLGARGWQWDKENNRWKTQMVWDPDGREWFFDETERRWKVRILNGHFVGGEFKSLGAMVERPVVSRTTKRALRGVGRALIIAYYTGTRANALRQLRWERNGKHGYFELRETDGTLYRSDFKHKVSSKGQGPCELADRLWQHAVRWRKRDLLKHKKCPVRTPGFPYTKIVIHQEDGRIYQGLQFSVKQAMKNAGLDVMPVTDDDKRFERPGRKKNGVSLHVYRHTFATLALDNGASPALVAFELDISLPVLWRTYGHRKVEGNKDVANAITRSRRPSGADRILALVEAMTDAMTGGTFEGMVDLFSPDGEWVIVATGETFRGLDQIRQLAKRYAAEQDLGSMTGKPPSVFFRADGKGFIWEYVRNCVVPDNRLSPEAQSSPGAKVNLPTLLMCDVREGKLVQIREYFDRLAIVSRLEHGF
jgi:ketosteroid isomerase-like protein/integrase